MINYDDVLNAGLPFPMREFPERPKVEILQGISVEEFLRRFAPISREAVSNLETLCRNEPSMISDVIRYAMVLAGREMFARGFTGDTRPDYLKGITE
jgi:hypothetical protein